jgi:hypothetical protein
MLRNLTQSIFKLPFLKNNFTEIILVLDKLGDLFKPYKDLKILLEKKDEENEKNTIQSLKNFITYFMTYETLIKIKLIMDLYKRKDNLLEGEFIDKLNDSVSIMTSILTILEVILCPNEKHPICKYISPLNNISLYSPYLIDSIKTIEKIYNLLKKENDIEGLDILKKTGIITSILLLFCSNNEFYKKNPNEIKIKKTIKIQTPKKLSTKEILTQKFKTFKDWIIEHPKTSITAGVAIAVGLNNANTLINNFGVLQTSSSLETLVPNTAAAEAQAKEKADTAEAQAKAKEKADADAAKAKKKADADAAEAKKKADADAAAAAAAKAAKEIADAEISNKKRKQRERNLKYN